MSANKDRKRREKTMRRRWSAEARAGAREAEAPVLRLSDCRPPPPDPLLADPALLLGIVTAATMRHRRPRTGGSSS